MKRSVIFVTSYTKLSFLPAIYSGAMEFLESRRYNDKMPIELTIDVCDFFVDKPAKDKDWLLTVFEKEMVTRYQVSTFNFKPFCNKHHII